MRRKKRFQGNRQRKQSRASHAPPPLAPLEPAERQAPIEYGKPFTLLEDENKTTFEFKTGAWVPYAMTIAQCRMQNCQVKQLPQKVNRMTRYEVRVPVGE